MCSWLDFVFQNQVKMQIFYAKTLTHCALCTGFGWHDSILVAVVAVLQVSSRAVGRFENPTTTKQPLLSCFLKGFMCCDQVQLEFEP